MNKVILTLSLALTLSAGIFLNSCQTPSPQEKKANDKVDDAQKNLDNAKANARTVASAEEWKTFKAESELKIQGNKIRIEELKLKMKSSGKNMNTVYQKRIDMLEKQNESLNEKISGYEKNQSDWESFKKEFNHDIDELGKSLKDFTIDNKN